MKIVKENISFQRGLGSKEALGIGQKTYFIEEMIKAGELEESEIPISDYKLLYLASKYSRLSLVRSLLNNNKEDREFKDHWGAIKEAANNGHLEILKELIDFGIPANIQDNIAIKRAVMMGRYDVVEFLLTFPEIKRFVKFNKEIIEWACEKSSLPIVNLLHKNEANIRHDDDICLFISINKGYPHIAEYLMKNGCNPSCHDNLPLIKSSRWGKEDEVRILLKYGADPYLKDKSGENAIEAALSRGNEEIVRIIEKNKK